MSLFLLVFTVYCLQGTIWESDHYTSTDLVAEGEYELDYSNGVYLYTSVNKDSVYFYIEDEFYYEYGDSSKFQIIR